MLYDMREDAAQFTHLATDPAQADTVKKLRGKLQVMLDAVK